MLQDFSADARAQFIGVKRIKFPAPLAVVGDEPRITRVLLLVGRREEWQTTEIAFCKRNPLHPHMIATVPRKPFRQIAHGHAQATWVPIANVEYDQWSAVFIVSDF